jgi:hypothetical protein
VIQRVQRLSAALNIGPDDHSDAPESIKRQRRACDCYLLFNTLSRTSTQLHLFGFAYVDMRADGALLALAGIAGVVAQPHCAERNTSSAAATAAVASTDTLLPRTIPSAPTAIKRFQQLLIGPDGLFTGDTLRKVIVFDFNGARPAPGSLGGTTKAAVSTVLIGFFRGHR